MGNNQPLVEGKAENVQHPRLGNIKVIKKEGDQTFIEYAVPVRNEQQIDHWQKMKQAITNSQTKEVLLLPISQQFERSGMCGSSGNLKLLFEDYLFLLESEIQNRADITRPFVQNEMWYLLYNIVRAGREYEKHDRKIGDVQPSNIVINEDGQTKIISMDSWPGQEDNFERVVASRQNKAFLAPEECVEQFLRKGEYPPGVNRNVAEAFGIGLTLLEAASLKNCSDIYTKSGDFSINQDTLRRILDSIRNSYSLYLVNTIESLLSIDPKARPSCGEIHAVFSPYENEIMNLEDFNFDPNSSEKCLLTFHKFNPKNKAALWSFKRLLGGNIPQGITNEYRQTYQNPNAQQIYTGGQPTQNQPIYSANVNQPIYGANVGAPQIVYTNSVQPQYPQYRR